MKTVRMILALPFLLVWAVVMFPLVVVVVLGENIARGCEEIKEML